MAILTLPRRQVTYKPPEGTPLNTAHPIVRGMVGGWALNEGGGTSLTDLTGNANTGTLVNAPTWVTTPYGAGLQFNGSNQRVNFGKASSLNVGARGTMFVVFQPLNTTPSFKSIFGASDLGTELNMYSLYQNTSSGEGKAHAEIADGTSHDAVLGTGPAIVQGTWYVMAVTWDGTTLRMYSNGVASGSVASTRVPNITRNVQFAAGEEPAEAEFWNGQIAVGYIWNRALGADEVAVLSSNPFAIFAPTAPVQRWWQVPAAAAATTPQPRLRALLGVGL